MTGRETALAWTLGLVWTAIMWGLVITLPLGAFGGVVVLVWGAGAWGIAYLFDERAKTRRRRELHLE